MMTRYFKSEQHLVLAEEVIPLGSQTFSKSRTQYPVGISPLFAKKAVGSKIQDLDGNWYIDLVNSLGAITLGYNNKKIIKAVKKQLKKGTIFSLPGVLEQSVASKIIEMVPSAESVRFAKNGTDATSAAVRIARAYTGRDIIAVCGYHGWADWYIGTTTKNKGVPASSLGLSRSFKYNQIDTLKNLIINNDKQIAAVVMEPMNSEFPKSGFLEEIRSLCTSHGIVLVFDETLTGFRLSSGGAQKYFNVHPDISTFGKGIANGYPLSVITGKREIMREMEEVFFSGTFGGELLSLAAASKVLDLHRDDKVCVILAEIGESIKCQVNNIIAENSLQNILELSGHPSWIFLNWYSTEKYSVEVLRTFFMQEMFSRGVLILNTHNISTSINESEIKFIVKSYSETLSLMAKLIKSNDLIANLKVNPIIPLFKVRGS